MELKNVIKLWGVLLIVTLVAVGVLITWFDVPIARYCLALSPHVASLSRGLSSSILVGCEVLLLATLAMVRIIRGALSEKSKAVFIATAASLSGFVANDYVLKLIFGRENPYQLFYGRTASQFLFFHGTQYSSFPSGHMVLATAFAMTIMRLYPRSVPYFLILLSAGASLLVIGIWHFAADVVAGTFVGGTVGFVAGELWLRHSQAHNQLLPL